MQNSDTPKVSLLVPICNVERYLRECLDSAVTQSLKDIEIVCINDGSTDSSPDIIREYMARDERVKMIDKANSGYGDSMNRGLEMARGEYVAFWSLMTLCSRIRSKSWLPRLTPSTPMLLRATSTCTGPRPASAVICLGSSTSI